MGRMSGKIALITGGTKGLGLATAEAFVREGARVVVAARTEREVAETAERLGDNAVGVALDVTDYASWERAIQQTEDVFGGLDVLVNNAGTASYGHIETYSLEDWHHIVDVNLHGTFYGMKVAIPLLKRSGSSAIINVSSVAGFRAMEKIPAYVATKFAVRGLTKQAALDLAEYGIRVNSVHPGTFHTPLTENLPINQEHVAQRRAGEPWELANLMLLLGSDESPFITGAEIAIDGGEFAGRMKPRTAPADATAD